MYCQNELMPNKLRPLLNTPIIRAPITVPPILLVPPRKIIAQDEEIDAGVRDVRQRINDLLQENTTVGVSR